MTGILLTGEGGCKRHKIMQSKVALCPRCMLTRPWSKNSPHFDLKAVLHGKWDSPTMVVEVVMMTWWVCSRRQHVQAHVKQGHSWPPC